MQESEATVAWCDGMFWIKCSDGLSWVPLEVADRIKLRAQQVNSVYYEWLFKQPGTIFYNPPNV